MRSVWFLSLVLSLAPATLAFSLPVKRSEISKPHKLPLEIEGFKYWFGDITRGYLYYLGTKDISGFETELHLKFLNNRISKILLILGPAGISSYDCLSKYKSAINILNKKYGHYTHQTITKDPLLDELVYTTICTPIKNELYSITNYWKKDNLRIISSLIGDEDGFYIEIQYIINSKTQEENKKDIIKIL